MYEIIKALDRLDKVKTGRRRCYEDKTGDTIIHIGGDSIELVHKLFSEESLEITKDFRGVSITVDNPEFLAVEHPEKEYIIKFLESVTLKIEEDRESEKKKIVAEIDTLMKRLKEMEDVQ